MTTLEGRKSAVLRAVVSDYIRTAEPVGSGRIVTRYRLRVSPATVRSEMAALEDLGYLRQPHTSAGRIPTDAGYRFFVDHLPPRPTLSPSRRRAISMYFRDSVPDVDEVVQGTAQLLSRVTGYAAVALSPHARTSRVRRAELIPFGDSAMLLLVADTGRVDKRVLDVPGEVAEDTIERASRTLGEALDGLAYPDAAARARRRARTAPPEESPLLEAAAGALRSLGEAPEGEHVFVGGVANIADERAFERRETLQRTVEALEERATALRLLRALPGEEPAPDLSVRIGHENPLRALREASVIVGRYRVGARPTGAVAIVGPTRMDYASSISTARAVVRRLSELIGGLAG